MVIADVAAAVVNDLLTVRVREELGEVTAAGVQQFIVLFFDLDNRIEVFRTAE